MPLNTIKRFLQLESTAGLLLVAAAAFALLISNTPFFFKIYNYVLSVPLVVTLGDLGVDKPLLLWINDGLMAVFFMLIGLEVKREVFEGELRSVSQIALPAAAAVGGFVVPALIYAAFNWETSSALEGWAIPAATDIAFALGVLTLLGSRVPIGLKVFLTTIAIFDDLAAIVVIALFYADNLSVRALAFAAAGLIILFIINRRGVMRIAPYIIIGTVVWLSVLKSGVHATLAGVLVAFMIPMKRDADGASPAQTLEHTLHPWVTYMIPPVFAFANAGVSFKGIPAEALTGSVAVGIAVSLFIGKQLGVFTMAWLMVKLGLARLPAGANWLAIYGIALLTGIGFTMSLFIGTLAFEAGEFNYIAATRVGVLAGSVASAVAGYAVLRMALRDVPD